MSRAEEYPHLKLGNPSKAKEDPQEKDNFLLKKKFFALSYNDGKGTPNWVSWRLVKDDLGSVPGWSSLQIGASDDISPLTAGPVPSPYHF